MQQPECGDPPIEHAGHALVIDDDPRVQNLLSRLLAGHGLDAARAGDGEDGLHRALVTAYDVILLDLHLPRLDGMTVLRRLLSTKPEQPIIVCSAQTDRSTREECFRAGALDFLAKPFTIAEFDASLRAAIEGAPPHSGVRADEAALRTSNMPATRAS